MTRRELQDQRPAASLRRWLPDRPGEDLEFLADAERYRWTPYRKALPRLGDLRKYDVVVSRYLQSALTFGLPNHPRWVLDVDDYLPDRIRDRLPLVNPLRRIALKRCLKYAQQAHETWIPKATACWISNPEDRRHPGLAEAVLLPNLPWQADGSVNSDDHNLPEPVSGPYLLFVGSMGYSANREALHWFLYGVWPEILIKVPSLKVVLIGGGLPERFAVKWRKLPNVVVAGRVADLSPWYRDATAVIAPMQSGAGTNIKVLEAAAFAKPMVVTPTALRGLDAYFQTGENCLLAETARDFATYCVSLFKDSKLGNKLGCNARTVTRQHFTPETFTTAVRSVLNRALGDTRIGS